MEDEFDSTKCCAPMITADEKDGKAGKIPRQHGVKRDDLLKVIEHGAGSLENH